MDNKGCCPGFCPEGLTMSEGRTEKSRLLPAPLTSILAVAQTVTAASTCAHSVQGLGSWFLSLAPLSSPGVRAAPCLALEVEGQWTWQ